MLKIACPNCKVEIKLPKPKQGKFAPTCVGCKTKFQLLIKEMPDGTFKYKAAPLPGEKTQATPKAAQSKPAPEATKATEKTHKPVPKAETQQSDQTELTAPKATQIAGETVDTGNTKADDDFVTTNPKKKPVKPSPKPAAHEKTISGRLGPYRLIKLLGQGGMGSVYLANQTTLDRKVALKVVRAKLAKHASMLARFTREAYAAAQLVHPNVVQIYDMGDDRGNCYFSMELVNGSSLHEYVNEKKKLDPEQATSFILHAARGLQCAHNAGMVHRDIKPANLLVNSDGIVKVADLGLVKVPDQEEIESEVVAAAAFSASQDLTQAGTTIGTPYYMAPEQAKSAISADHRADIYSLGCTYYVLLTGKRPFEGNSIEEVVSKHTSQPLVMPSQIVERVPPKLSQIVAKMMAKRPEDRYQSMGELITELEAHLGFSSAETFTPDEADADAIEFSAKQFNSSPLLKVRPILPLALVVGSLLLAVVMAFVGWRWATGALLMPLAAIASYFVISGLKEDGLLFNQVRELAYKSGILNWIKWGLAALLLVAASFLTGTILHWVVFALLGVGLGAACYFVIDKAIDSSRKDPIEKAELLVRRMRLKGMEESTVQMFVAKYCGKHWEEFFEHLFGYEAKRKIRDDIKNQGAGKRKPKFRAWRDSIHDNLAKRLDELASDEDQKHLQKIEQAGLEAEGVSAAEAKEQAAQMAEALVDHGESVRVAALQKRLLELDPEAQRLQKRLKIKAMLAEARSGKYKKELTPLQKIETILNRFLGSYTRFLLGCLLIVGCLLWARQNSLFEGIAATAQIAIEPESGTGVDAEQVKALAAKETQPLKMPLLGGVFFNFNSLIAGLILVCSTIVFGWRMSLFALPAAAVTIWGGAFGIPDILPYPIVHAVSAVIGIGIFMVGIVFGRSEA